MGEAPGWTRGVVWSDQKRVDNPRLLLVRDPHGLEGQRVVLRVADERRLRLARLERSTVGSQAFVHPALARELKASGERFEAEWRRARWRDVLKRVDRIGLAAVAIVALAGIAVAAAGLKDTADKVGWSVAVPLLVLSVAALVTVSVRDWRSLSP